MSKQTTKGNIFDDPELFDPSESEILKTKAFMLISLRNHIRDNKLSDEKIALMFAVEKSKVQALKEMQIDTFSIDELVSFLEKCSLHVILHSEIIAQ